MFKKASSSTKASFAFFVILAIVVVFAVAMMISGSHQARASEGPEPDVVYTLAAVSSGGKPAFVGVGGAIDGVKNPELKAELGQTVEITLLNQAGGSPYNLVIGGMGLSSDTVSRQGDETHLVFRAAADGEFDYYSSLSGYRYSGMQGKLVVGSGAQTASGSGASGPGQDMNMDMSSGSASQTSTGQPSDSQPTVSFKLETNMVDGKMAFVGMDGDLAGKANPDLVVKPGDVVEIVLVDGDGIQHNLHVPDFNAQSADVQEKGAETRIVFTPDKEGAFPYFCAIPGHRQAGMEGKLLVGNQDTASQAANLANISRAANDLPAPLNRTTPENVRVDLETVEVPGRLADGTEFTFWTFNGKVPGPFLRVMVGDTVEVHLKNATGSTMMHSVDFHAVTGPGGGAVATQTKPGEETSFTFKALTPGLYVYHCATPMVAQHIANGMYGLILVEPEGGLPPVDREYYVMQGEVYTSQPYGQQGQDTFDQQALLDERPQYFVFNGAVGALTGDGALKANVGETVRIFFGVGGPNKTSSFHVIGEIFDRVFDQASLTSAPLTDVQTTLVPPGGATMVEFQTNVPGRYILVDHALARLERGLAGFLMVEGDPAPDIFNGVATPGSGH